MIECGRAGECTVHKRFRRALQLKQRDGVSCGGWTGQKMVVEHQPVGTDRVAEMVRRIAILHQIDEFTIVRRRDHNMWLEIVSVTDQLSQYRFTCGDPLDCIGASKQFIQKKQTLGGISTCPYPTE